MGIERLEVDEFQARRFLVHRLGDGFERLVGEIADDEVADHVEKISEQNRRSDQQARSTLAAYGNDRIRVPRMNALAERSTVFHRAYCAQPVCGPARAALFSGTYPHRNGQITLDRHPMHDHVPCLTDLLDDRWACGFFGRSGHHRYAGGPAPRAGGIETSSTSTTARRRRCCARTA